MDVNALRKLTQKAKKRIEKQRKEKIQIEKTEKGQKSSEEKLKAQTIIEQIPNRAEAEARVGRNHAIIMEIGCDYNRPLELRDPVVCDRAWLKSAAKIVWNYCTKAGLDPTVDYWYDWIGHGSGFNIVIHW